MIKEHDNRTWHGKAYSKIVDTTQQVTSFPVVVRPTKNTIPSWTIKGNMVQDGTPSPSNIIYPSETGDRTGNLFDKTAEYVVGLTTHNCTISGLDPNKYYTCSTNFDRISGVSTASLYFGGGASNINGVWSDTPRTFKPNSSGEIIVYIRYKKSDGAPSIIDNVMAGTIWVMVNEGSTPLPYEPYGYKLPIKTGSTTTPVYLGEVQTTRKIKKVVFTGTENVSYNARNDTVGRWVVTIPTANGTTTPENVICTHFKTVNATTKPLSEGGICMRSTGVDVVVGGLYTDIGITAPSDSTTIVNAVKAYLAQQYAAGTPVCVWYVLATPEIAVVNEPLRKIGTYSDSVSGTNLSVTAQSPTTIDVDTTLKPSEMDLTYTGLKMCKRKKYAGLLADNPLCGRGSPHKDTLNLANGDCTRKIGKVVFKGTENWYDVPTNGVYYTNVVKDLANKNNYTPMCSHFKLIPQAVIANLTDGSFTSDNNVFFWFKETSITSLADWKAWLAQRYAAGTPVCVWYVLSTPTTETITVPSGLSGTEEGYLNQSGTPTPTNPIYPTANDVPLWQ